MRAVRSGDGGIEVVDIPAPTGQGVRVRVVSAGICGSDLHLAGSELVRGVTLGHEIAGVTEDGTPVAVEPLEPCGTCPACVRGEYNLCVRSSAMVFGIGLDGGMAEEIVVPERCLVPLPSGVPVADASLVEPLAVLVHTARRAGLHPGQRIAVVGGGTIGLCAIAAARSAGCEVSFVARHDHQRAAAERLGASPVDGGDYDVVIEAAGTASALGHAVQLARPGALITIPGVYWEDVAIPGLAVCFGQLTLSPVTLYGRQAGSRDVDVAAALLAAEPAIADTLITHRFPLDAAREAFAVAGDRAAGAIKVVLEP